MIFKDANNFPLNETYDGMDSAVRAGIAGTFFGLLRFDITKYEQSPGILVRHPNHFPSNNPKNFTRDQMMCLVTALPKEIVRRVFFKTVKRFFFAQNIDRDIPGSTKYLFPHTFINDHGVSETRICDGPDPLFPHHLGHLVLCARLYPLYPLLILSYPLLALSCIFNSQKIDAEQNQLQCLVKRAGKPFVALYKMFNPQWKEQTRHYWDSKNEPEYANYIIGGL